MHVYIKPFNVTLLYAKLVYVKIWRNYLYTIDNAENVNLFFFFIASYNI